MRVKIYCLICDEKIPVPKDVDFKGTLGDILGWVNDHLTCPRCAHLPYYSNTPIKLGVKKIEKKLGKKSDEPDKQLGTPQRTIPVPKTV